MKGLSLAFVSGLIAAAVGVEAAAHPKKLFK